MKYRTDFVTNSSSSSNVVYKVSIMVSDLKKSRDILAFKVEGEEELHKSSRAFQTAINERLKGYNEIFSAYRQVIVESIISVNAITDEVEKQNVNNIIDDIIATPCKTFEDFENSKLWTLLGKQSNETLLFLDESLDASYASWGYERDAYYDRQGEELKATIDFRDYDRRFEKLKCPICNKKMTIRVSKFGPFYGCADYPKCTGKLKFTDRYHNVESDFMIFKDKNGNNVLKVYNGSQSHVIIPDDVNVIGEKAFDGLKFIEKITIPNSVSRIERHAFHRCGGLKEINIPNSVQFIGASAFMWCYSLTSITIPESITNISDRLFFGNFQLTKVNLPNTIESMGVRVFHRCDNMEFIQLPAKITKISIGMFEDCFKLIEVRAPGKIIEIGEKGFSGCHKLKYIELSPQLHYFGNDALAYCHSLSEDTFAHFEPQIKVKQTNQIWLTLETHKTLGESMVTGNINSVVLLCNNFDYLRNNIKGPIHAKRSKTLLYTTDLQNHHIKMVSLSNNYAIKADNLDDVMKGIDHQMDEIVKQGRLAYGKSDYCNLMYFRLRSDYGLDHQTKETYIAVIRKQLELILKDLLEREGIESLITLIETGVVTSRNISSITKKYASEYGETFVAKMNELKDGLSGK